MNCPVCTTVPLTMADRSGIEIDYCPQCRGVWLDRGELDKIIERAAPALAPAQQPQYAPQAPAMAQPGSQYPPRYGRDHDDDHDDDHERKGLFGRDPRRRKREGILGELFDF